MQQSAPVPRHGRVWAHFDNVIEVYLWIQRMLSAFPAGRTMSRVMETDPEIVH
jgi:hypothetical protein